MKLFAAGALLSVIVAAGASVQAPAVSATFHHFHFRVGDPAAAMNQGAASLGGTRVLTLPKGHLEAGERPEDAAIREVREEAGVDARLVAKLDDLHYWYQRGGMRIAKIVTFFLLDYLSGEPSEHDPDEVEDARWMPLDEAEAALTYRGERGMVALAKVHPACRF